MRFAIVMTVACVIPRVAVCRIRSAIVLRVPEGTVPCAVLPAGSGAESIPLDPAATFDHWHQHRRVSDHDADSRSRRVGPRCEYIVREGTLAHTLDRCVCGHCTRGRVSALEFPGTGGRVLLRDLPVSSVLRRRLANRAQAAWASTSPELAFVVCLALGVIGPVILERMIGGLPLADLLFFGSSKGKSRKVAARPVDAAAA